MMKSLKTFIVSIFCLSVTLSQELCPPALVNALFYNEKIELSWDQTTSWGSCFMNSVLLLVHWPPQAMTVVHVDSSCGACSGGWFRYSDGTANDCGSGMFPCSDGGVDTIFLPTQVIPGTSLIRQQKCTHQLIVVSLQMKLI